MRQKQRIVEEILVRRAQDGDRRALGQLAELRGPRLLAHATRLLGEAEAARDIVQESWLDIMRGLPNLREPVAFPAWCTRIVTRRVAGAIRKKVADRELAANMPEPMPVNQEAGPMAAEARNIRRAIDQLPPEQAATVALFYLEEMSVTEVAVALDVPVGTVKTRLMHARTKLKAALKGEHHE